MMSHRMHRLAVPRLLLILILVTAASTASAARVDLDGVSNAGFAANMPSSYLYITDGGYVYQWNYGKSAGSLPWVDVNDLVTDLEDNILQKAGQSTAIGDWMVESGGDPFNHPADPIWKSIKLDAGAYTLKLTSDSRAYDLSSYTWPKETPGHAWNAYVQIYADYGDGTSGSFNFGEAPAFIKPTEAEALAFYRSFVDGKQILLSKAAEVYFFINDINSVDNAGSVSLQIQPVPLPGAVYMLASGAVALAVIRRRLRAKE